MSKWQKYYQQYYGDYYNKAATQYIAQEKIRLESEQIEKAEKERKEFKEKVAKEHKRISGARLALAAEKSSLAKEVESIKEEMASSTTPVIRHYEIISNDDLAAIARDITDSIPKIAFLVHDPSCTVFLCSKGDIDCGKLVKENADIYRGKGGGNKNNARAIFPNKDMLDTYLQLLGMIL